MHFYSCYGEGDGGSVRTVKFRVRRDPEERRGDENPWFTVGLVGRNDLIIKGGDRRDMQGQRDGMGGVGISLCIVGYAEYMQSATDPKVFSWATCWSIIAAWGSDGLNKRP